MRSNTRSFSSKRSWFDPAIPPAIIDISTGPSTSSSSSSSMLPPRTQAGIQKARNMKKRTTGGVRTRSALPPFVINSSRRESLSDVFQNMLLLGNHRSEPSRNSLSTIDGESSTIDHPLKSQQANYNDPFVITEDMDDQEVLIRTILNGKYFIHPSFFIQYRGKSCLFRDEKCFVCIFENRLIKDNEISVKFIYRNQLSTSDLVPIHSESHIQIPRDAKRYIDGDTSVPRYIDLHIIEDFYVLLTEVVGVAKERAQLSVGERIVAKIGFDVRWGFQWNEHFKRI